MTERVLVRAGEGGEIGIGEGEGVDDVEEVDEMGVGSEETEPNDEVGEVFWVPVNGANTMFATPAGTEEAEIP